MNYPFVSIIITNYNGKRFLKNCLSSVLKQSYPKNKFKIIVVDDASTDDSVKYVKENFPKVKVLSLKKNVGYAGANNAGYKIAKGRYVILLNNDTIVPKNWLKPLVETAESDDNVAAVSSMPFYPGRKLIERYGEKLNYSPVCINRSDPNKNDPIVLYPSSESCLVRKKFFDSPFDPGYSIYQEDTYLGWKAWLQGHKVLFDKNSKFWHITSPTYGFFTKKQIYFNERNRITNILLFFKSITIFLMFPLFLTDFLVRQIYFIFSLRFDLVAAEFSAIAHNFSNVKTIYKKRKKIQKSRKVNDYIILEAFCENTYGEKIFVKRFLNSVFKKYFRFVKKTCKFFSI